LLLAAIAGGLLWSGWKWWELRRYRRAMARIEEEIDNGRNSLAARELAALLTWKPDSDEALNLLGACEMARGRLGAASDAWAKVSPGSRFAPQAILGRVQVQMEQGRLSEAETIIRDALNDPRVDGSSLPILLGPVYCQQGRLEETLRLLEARWSRLDASGEGASEQAIELVRAYIELKRSPIPVEVIRSALDRAAQLAPEDDRTWLGKASLAIRAGSLDEAARWLDACLRRRPDDAPVWRVRLDWAMASNRVAEAREALSHLPAAEMTPAQVWKLAAWFAARRGDAASERQALERLSATDPADRAALDRLTELAVKDGQADRAADLRRRKSEIERLEARYFKLYRRNQPARDAAEMARLAEQLGRWFEAKVLLTVATEADPDRDDLRGELGRLKRRSETAVDLAGTLAGLLANEADAETGPPSRPAGSHP
jgi:predicted Zn-dependent protease